MNIDIYQLIENSSFNFKILNKPTVIANATMNLGNLGIHIRGFIIGCKGDVYWSAPPSFGRSGLNNKNLFIVWFEDSEVWAYLSKKIIDQFLNEFSPSLPNQETTEMVNWSNNQIT